MGSGGLGSEVGFAHNGSKREDCLFQQLYKRNRKTGNRSCQVSGMRVIRPFG